MRKIGYIRVSTKEQSTDRQTLGLKGLCDELHIEQISASVDGRARPVYKRVLKRLKAGDALVIWDLDRAFRSTVDAINEARALSQRGVRLKIVNLNVDTAKASGMLVYTIMSAIAEHERAFLIERTKQGIEAARRRGKTLGRPRKLSPQQVADARRRVDSRESTITHMAKEYGVGRWTLSRALNHISEAS